MLLLDFGTVIKLDDYKVDITNLTKKEIMEVADCMKENESLGSTTDSYGSLGDFNLLEIISRCSEQQIIVRKELGLLLNL